MAQTSDTKNDVNIYFENTAKHSLNRAITVKGSHNIGSSTCDDKDAETSQLQAETKDTSPDRQSYRKLYNSYITFGNNHRYCSAALLGKIYIEGRSRRSVCTRNWATCMNMQELILKQN